MSIRTGAGMKHVVSANDICRWIRKKRESVSGLLKHAARFVRTVNADGHRSNSRLSKLVQILFDAPQLGVA